MHETSFQIPSNLLFEPQELTLRNLFLNKQPHPKAHGTSFFSRPQVQHRNASTGLSEVFPDVDRTCGWKADLLGFENQRGHQPSALNGKDTKHLRNANLQNSTSLVPNPKSGDCRHPEPSPATPEELSSTAPPFSAADVPWMEMFPPEWWKLLLTSIAPTGRGGRNMI